MDCPCKKCHNGESDEESDISPRFCCPTCDRKYDNGKDYCLWHSEKNGCPYPEPPEYDLEKKICCKTEECLRNFINSFKYLKENKSLFLRSQLFRDITIKCESSSNYEYVDTYTFTVKCTSKNQWFIDEFIETLEPVALCGGITCFNDKVSAIIAIAKVDHKTHAIELRYGDDYEEEVKYYGCSPNDNELEEIYGPDEPIPELTE